VLLVDWVIWNDQPIHKVGQWVVLLLGIFRRAPHPATARGTLVPFYFPGGALPRKNNFFKNYFQVFPFTMQKMPFSWPKLLPALFLKKPCYPCPFEILAEALVWDSRWLYDLQITKGYFKGILSLIFRDNMKKSYDGNLTNEISQFLFTFTNFASKTFRFILYRKLGMHHFNFCIIYQVIHDHWWRYMAMWLFESILEMPTEFCCVWCIILFDFDRAQSSSISKMEVSEDNEPALSKLDVVLNFTLEVRKYLT
jgi:hypothetical protein